MRKRVEIEEVENGFTVDVWSNEGEEEEMYPERKEHIASDMDEAFEIAKKVFNKKK